jgi:hypothetical protein
MRAALFDAALFDDGAAVLCHPVILSSRRPLLSARKEWLGIGRKGIRKGYFP